MLLAFRKVCGRQAPCWAWRDHFTASNVTYAKALPSGDHELTLIVPCPPVKLASTSGMAGVNLALGRGSRRNWTCSVRSLCPLVPGGTIRTPATRHQATDVGTSPPSHRS